VTSSQQVNPASPLDLPAEDLQRCHDVLGETAWDALAGQRLFVTGGTGFVGKWLLGTLLDANTRRGLDCSITVLSRDPSAFLQRWPSMAHRVQWMTGDVRDFPIGQEEFDVIIHAATDVVADSTPEEIFSTCVDGTRRVLALAKKCFAKQMLLVSSGAIYGPLPPGMTHVPESYLGGPDPLKSGSAYGEGKRVSEWLAVQAADEKLSVKIARVFALVGPHLPLDKHFAIGNFLGAAMTGKDIIIKGDGTPYRSYLYAADMAAWLWAVLIRGESLKAYNVGSDESLSIVELADRICQLLNSNSIISLGREATFIIDAKNYVPDVSRSRKKLELQLPLPLGDAIIRTAEWHVKMENQSR
jgi:nucleoside-diphosphate-sugar epimerase